MQTAAGIFLIFVGILVIRFGDVKAKRRLRAQGRPETDLGHVPFLKRFIGALLLLLGGYMVFLVR